MALQQLSLITLGIAELARSKRFYVEGFGWRTVFENNEIVFYQMQGLVLGTWLEAKLAADMQQPRLARPGAFALAHNLRTREAVQPLMDRLVQHGGRLLKAPVEPPHGGFAGYVADPDGHAWDIAWNPAWSIGADGRITFAI
jgi:catechol 2,3-dioxygenase-like lactoylglutathione lyase family enzyme